MRILTGILTSLLLAGCSTSPVSIDKADPVPQARIHGFSTKTESQLVVTRDTGLFGSGVNYSLYIDGALAAEFASGEVARFGISPGRHILGLAPSTMFGGSQHESEINVKPGEVIRRRISLDGGGFHLTPTAY